MSAGCRRVCLDIRIIVVLLVKGSKLKISGVLPFHFDVYTTLSVLNIGSELRDFN
jgi:hypothetical protein